MTSPFLVGSLVVAYLRDSGGDEQDLSFEQQEQVLRKQLGSDTDIQRYRVSHVHGRLPRLQRPLRSGLFSSLYFSFHPHTYLFKLMFINPKEDY